MISVYLTGKCMFNFLSTYQTDFQSGSSILHSYQQSRRETVFLHPCQHLVLLVFFTLTILVGVWWYLTVILICISLVTGNVEHLFMCLPAISRSSPVHLFAHFLIGFELVLL